jgi:type IV pilus assembly protein PilC
MAAKKEGQKRVKSIPRRKRTVTIFTRQMATLLAAKVPLVKALETLLRQTPAGPFRTVLEGMAVDVRGGSRFSQALGRYPRIFDTLILNMVLAGEASGNLAVVLGRVADFREKAGRTQGKVIAALVYPVIVMVVAVLIVALLMAVVIPQFQNIYATTMRGRELPALTQALIDISTFVQNNAVLMIVGIILLIVGTQMFMRTKRGKVLWDRFTYFFPLFKGLVQRLAVTRFSRTFGTLIDSGVPLLDALRISRDVVGHTVVQKALDEVRDRVKDGDPLARPLERTGVFPAFVPSMVEVGEETGQLGQMCERIADTYEEELDTTVTGLTALIEPIMIVVLALVVGSIVIALFLPIATIFQQGGLG